MGNRLLMLCSVGAVAGTFAALALLAARRGVPLTQIVNASTHMVDGDRAARQGGFSIGRSGGGTIINVGAAIFWGSASAITLNARAPARLEHRLLAGPLTALVASIVDYGLVPRRLTPGWELVLPKADVALALAGMAIGISAGALFDLRLEERDATS
jgi:hypothetical protein